MSSDLIQPVADASIAQAWYERDPEGFLNAYEQLLHGLSAIPWTITTPGASNLQLPTSRTVTGYQSLGLTPSDRLVAGSTVPLPFAPTTGQISGGTGTTTPQNGGTGTTAPQGGGPQPDSVGAYEVDRSSLTPRDLLTLRQQGNYVETRGEEDGTVYVLPGQPSSGSNYTDALTWSSTAFSEAGEAFAANGMRGWMIDQNWPAALVNAVPDAQIAQLTTLHGDTRSGIVDNAGNPITLLNYFGPNAAYLDAHTIATIAGQEFTDNGERLTTYAEAIELAMQEADIDSGIGDAIATLQGYEGELRDLDKSVDDILGENPAWDRILRLAEGEEQSIPQSVIDRQLALSDEAVNDYIAQQTLNAAMSMAERGEYAGGFSKQLSEQAATRAMQTRIREGSRIQAQADEFNATAKNHFIDLAAQLGDRAQARQVMITDMLGRTTTNIAQLQSNPATSFLPFTNITALIQSMQDADREWAAWNLENSPIGRLLNAFEALVLGMAGQALGQG